MNIILPIEVIVTSKEATNLAPTGKLTCGICPTCAAIVPIRAMDHHDLKLHPEAK